MEKEYEDFVDEFQQKLREVTGYGEDRIFYKRKDEYPPTEGDRIFVNRVVEDEVTEVCALYAGELFEEYKNGMEMDVMIRNVIIRMSRLEKADIADKIRGLNDYEKIRKALFIRLINKNKHKEELKDSLFFTIGDIALVLYVHLGEAEGCTTSMKVKRPMIDLWEKAPDEVMEAALLNTYFISPPRIYCWEKMIFDPFYEGENFMDVMRDYPLRKDAVGNCLSTVKRTNGAVAIFLPGVAERLADLFQGGFYLVFTSIHEVMIHSEKTVDPKDLRRVLADTVRETTPEEDFLTFHIYYYDKDSGIFSLCLKGEEERD